MTTEPTEAMLQDGVRAYEEYLNNTRSPNYKSRVFIEAMKVAYKAMMKAAPEEIDETIHEDTCGLCGKSGADKIPHPIKWPGENSAGTELVHAACEDAECSRASQSLSDKQRKDFLRTI